MFEDPEIVLEFLTESNENLARLDQEMVELEQHPGDKNLLASVFRTIHTIKGTCGFLGFSRLESLAHAGESLLSQLRDGHLALTPERTSGLLSMVDAIRQTLTCIEVEKNEGTTDYTSIIEHLTRLREPVGAASEPAGLAEVKVVSVLPPSPPLPPPDPPLKSALPVPVTAPPPADEYGSQPGPHVFESNPVPGVFGGDLAGAQPIADGRTSVADTNIRVDVGLLDKLMNLVGELVLARNQILQFTATQEDTAFIATSQRLNLITTELQEGVMKTRMQPIGNIWSKFPRIVRDLALACGKRVQIDMEGKETELDRTIIEAIKDPLTHIVRNSIDHGIELPEVRESRGKSPEGRLFLRAFHEGGQVNIEISDDGAGIDPDRIKAKALQRGMFTPEQANRLTDRELINLIFAPGFSTAEKVTNVSGRGVGMDVVKTNIEKIGGTLDILNRLGEGTTLKIKIPLTLAIIPALMVTTGGDRYAIPQVSLLELVRLEGTQAHKGIETIQGTPVYRLRGNLLPLVYLNRELQVQDPSVQSESDIINIVVVQADDRQFGMVVDEINDTEEIVVKPLGKQLKGLSTFAGATILGDGRVALILDVLGIAQRANVVSELRDRAIAEKTLQHQDASGNRQTLLLFQIGEADRMAIPLSMVARLEEFSRQAIERAGGQEVVQYRHQIMPLIRLSKILGRPASRVSDSDQMQVIVYSEQDNSVGFVVDQILDIVDETLTVQRRSTATGFLGSAVIQGRVTDLVDVHGVIRSVDPTFFTRSAGV